MPKDLSLFLPMTKVDAQKRLVYGVATAEIPDKSGEICDYASSKPYFERWSREIELASKGQSLGNLRAMHGQSAAGKIVDIHFNDAAKQVEICAKIVDEQEWQKVIEGVYTGFSQGGRYVKRWPDNENPQFTRYTAAPAEISLVDLPCLPDASFEIIKADGLSERRSFRLAMPPFDADVAQVWSAHDGSTFRKKADAIAHNLTLIAQGSQTMQAQTDDSAETLQSQAQEAILNIAIAAQILAALADFECDEGEPREGDENSALELALCQIKNDVEQTLPALIAVSASTLSSAYSDLPDNGFKNKTGTIDKAFGMLKSDYRRSLAHYAPRCAELHLLTKKMMGFDASVPVGDNAKARVSMSERVEFAKMFSSVSQRLDDLAEEITALKAEPQPHPLYRAIAKSQDGRENPETLDTAFSSLPNEQRAALLIKLAQTLPQPMHGRGSL